MSVPDPTAANIANYETAWSAEQYTRDRGFWSHEVPLIERFMPKPPARMLDLGCGAGRTSIGFAERGYDTVAIDLSDQLLRLGKQLYPQVDFRKMDATALDFPDASFDAAMFSYNGIDCIQPLAGRLKCMAEVFRVLKPGAPFLLSSHNFLGSCFSGGFYYLTGHWNALRSLAYQWNNPAFFRGYAKYHDGGGAQLLYSGAPAKTARQLQDAGFGVELVQGYTGRTDPGSIRWHESHVHFAARKPADAS